MPAIRDVETMLELVADLGVDVDRLGGGDVRVHAGAPIRRELDEELCRQIRAWILLSGPLLAREGEAIVPPPGGDVIGRRRLDTHIRALVHGGRSTWAGVTKCEAPASEARASSSTRPR